MKIRIPQNLFSVDTNPKTIKGQKYGYVTAVLYLAPYNISGVNLCPMAELAQCHIACLYSAGRGAFNSTQTARINKTRYFLEQTPAFMRHAAIEIHRIVRKTRARGMIPLVRLNGTSDIRWENIPVSIDAETARKINRPAGEYANIFALFPDVQFYDYTKIPNRKDIPENYDLTFSFSGAPGFEKINRRAHDAGMRIAVVFDRQENIPAEFMGRECIDGDDSDIRHIDAPWSAVALYAKGRARRDSTGFVVRPNNRVIPIHAAA